MDQAVPQALEPRALRRAFGRFATGVTIVTAHPPDAKPEGMTANSFASLSLDPPLLLWCQRQVQHEGHLHGAAGAEWGRPRATGCAGAPADWGR